MKFSTAESAFINKFRIIAAIFLVVGHGLSIFQPLSLSIFTYPSIVYIQNIAVVMLLVLSGFLTKISLDNKYSFKSYRFEDYLTSRVRRIYPELFITLILVFILDIIFINISNNYPYIKNLSISTAIGNLLFLQGFPGISLEAFGSARPLWTLSYEWWLYLSAGWYIFRIKNKPFNALNYIIAFVLIYFPSNSLKNFLFYNEISIVVYFLIGWVSVYIFGYIRKTIYNKSILKITFSFLLLCTTIRVLYTKEAYDIVFGALVSITLIFGLQLSKVCSKKPKNFRLLSILTEHTYSMYLIHYSVFLLVNSLSIGLWKEINLIIGILISLFFSRIINISSNLIREKSSSVQTLT